MATKVSRISILLDKRDNLKLSKSSTVNTKLRIGGCDLKDFSIWQDETHCRVLIKPLEVGAETED